MASLCVKTQIRTPCIITKFNDRDAELYHRLENTVKDRSCLSRSAGPSPCSLIAAEFVGMRRGSDSPSLGASPFSVSKTALFDTLKGLAPVIFCVKTRLKIKVSIPQLLDGF